MRLIRAEREIYLFDLGASERGSDYSSFSLRDELEGHEIGVGLVGTDVVVVASPLPGVQGAHRPGLVLRGAGDIPEATGGLWVDIDTAAVDSAPHEAQIRRCWEALD